MQPPTGSPDLNALERTLLRVSRSLVTGVVCTLLRQASRKPFLASLTLLWRSNPSFSIPLVRSARMSLLSSCHLSLPSPLVPLLYQSRRCSPAIFFYSLLGSFLRVSLSHILQFDLSCHKVAARTGMTKRSCSLQKRLTHFVPRSYALSSAANATSAALRLGNNVEMLDIHKLHRYVTLKYVVTGYRALCIAIASSSTYAPSMTIRSSVFSRLLLPVAAEMGNRSLPCATTPRFLTTPVSCLCTLLFLL